MRDFSLYRSVDDGPFEAVETAITDTSRLYVGQIGHRYQFFTRARDNAGNLEPLKTEAEAITIVSTEDGASEVPKEFALYQNFPNPFNPTTTIPFDVAEPGEVAITVYDILGRRVLRVDRGELKPGRYQQLLNLSHLASGVYLYEIRVVDARALRFRDVGKLVFVK